MSRRPRINLPGYPQHVVQRGHNRDACFYAEEDYLFYLHWLREGMKKYEYNTMYRRVVYLDST